MALKNQRAWLNMDILKNFTVGVINNTCDKKFTSIEEYLQAAIPKPVNPRKARLDIFNKSGYSEKKCLNETRLCAFSAHMFPPMTVKTTEHEYVLGDVFPQFYVEKERKGKFVFRCTICKIYENGTGNKCKSSSLCFDGISQAIDHGKSGYHSKAITYFVNGRRQMMQPPTKDGILIFPIVQPGGKITKTRCYYVHEEGLVKFYENKSCINRMKGKKLFALRTDLHCKDHKNCSDYNTWKEMHPDKNKELLKKEIGQASFQYLNDKIYKNGKWVQLTGGIRSDYPQCTGSAYSGGEYAYTCKNCQSLVKELRRLMKTTSQAKLEVGNREGKQGMRLGYLDASEKNEKMHMDKRLNTDLAKENQNLKKELEGWNTKFEKSVLVDNESQFCKDLNRLLQSGKADENPLQMNILENLTSKLLRGKNHKYCDSIMKVARMQRNWLGESNYSLIQVM